MNNIYHFLIKRYPQNYILKKPLQGSAIFLLFSFVFIMIYRPLGTHESRFLSYTLTMAAYCAIFTFIKLLKKSRFYSDTCNWTFLKEVSAIGIVLSVMGISVFAAGFFMEVPAARWNLATFIDSFLNSVLIGIVPFAFFSTINYRHLVTRDVLLQMDLLDKSEPAGEEKAPLIKIASKLKKEELNFYPDQFLYAESDGNYVVFHLSDGKNERKEIIRNSISSISQQLSEFPWMYRTHRAFIVNLKKITAKDGNSLGYRLKLSGTNTEVPVSRQNVHDFDRLAENYLLPLITKK